MNNSYNYIFHHSNYREPSQRWACIHREDLQYYWNGPGPFKGHEFKPSDKLRISYGSTADEAASKLNIAFE